MVGPGRRPALVLALVVAVALAAASATSLGAIEVGGLGAGAATTGSCDLDGVTTSFTTAYEASVPGYAVTAVVVGEVAAACDGQAVTVTVTDTGGLALGRGSATVAGATTTVPLTPALPASAVPAEGVSGVSVAITG